MFPVNNTDGTSKVLNGGYTLSTYKANKAGTKTVTVNYEGAEAGFRINTKMSFIQVILTVFGFGWLLK